MFSTTLNNLEFHKVIDIIGQFAHSELGREGIALLRPSCEIEVIEQNLGRVKEMVDILGVHGHFPLHGLKDIRSIIEISHVEGAVLTPQQIYEVYQNVEMCVGVKRFIRDIKDLKLPLTREMNSKIIVINEISHKVVRSIDSKGDFLDTASEKIANVRKEIRALRGKIQEHLEKLFRSDDLSGVFRENLITIRNERYVVPVKSEEGRSVTGIIHDYSQSRATIFIEPLSIVNFNNQLNILLKEEEEEKFKVLQKLTACVLAYSVELTKNVEILKELDAIYARAMFANTFGCTFPTINKNGNMKLICAKHPLLIAKELNYLKSDGPCIPPVEKAVPIDVYFGDDYKTFVITGANMGGKTVALKTIGLLTVMYQAGIPIPVSPQSDIAIFDSLFAEIGEKQGIESSLSTFTSHIVNIRKIIDEICGVSLVLVDEIGTGTDPNEGAALALAIIEYLKEKNTKVIITTHYNLVKAYALRCSDMTSVFVEFNPKEDKPTYNLIYGLPGNSNGLFVAQKMGISNEVIKKATHFLGERENYLVNLLEQLSMILGDFLHSKDELVKVKDAAYRYQRDLELMVNEVKKKRKDVFAKFENEAEHTLNNAERDIKRLIQEMKDTHQSPDLKSIQKSFEDIKEVIFSKSFEDEGSERSEIQNIVKGDRVFITPLGKEGKICEVISHKNVVEVLVGTLKIKVPLSALKKIDTQGLPCSDSRNKRDFFRICPELLSENEKRSERVSLIGFSVEDAISCMDEVLDKALLNDISELALIHGFGSGRLKDAVRRFLKDHPHVKGYQTAETSKGGDGVTIVQMDV